MKNHETIELYYKRGHLNIVPGNRIEFNGQLRSCVMTCEEENDMERAIFAPVDYLERARKDKVLREAIATAKQIATLTVVAALALYVAAPLLHHALFVVFNFITGKNVTP